MSIEPFQDDAGHPKITPQSPRNGLHWEIQMEYLIGILLIVFGAPLVGLIGHWVENSGHDAAGKVISVGGYLLVLGVAAWLIIGSL
ncbi:hypothetical protein ABT124_48665 [Streptomyces sp. NPDC001982]|uniref:hypothetical protein n=1 Tax=unclassified Streptomyces TaxID=2593676 RepID=UPI003331973C